MYNLALAIELNDIWIGHIYAIIKYFLRDCEHN